MIAFIRSPSARRLAAALALIGGALSAPGQAALAQAAPTPAPSGTPVPVELAISVLNGRVVCLPQTMRLPARDLVGLHVVNKSTRPILFAAPDFFRASEGLRTGDVEYNPRRGGFLVRGNSTLPVTLRTPPAGEYYYACNDPGEVSTVLGTGFIVVVPGSDTPGGQAPVRR